MSATPATIEERIPPEPRYRVRIHTAKSVVEPEPLYAIYGRGEGLVDSPRHLETGVFPLVLPLRSSSNYLSLRREHRRVHRGYNGLSMRLDVHRPGGGRHGA